ncbi:MAG: hypothetical protein A2898_04220 [Candidatus Kerfeldbacteria bacterium RIFCSPLOWO2_01_FULL_48_11]|uniref:Glycosyltransferase 2-like domain-containing protein n=1 Tax=Candidatus Kerfeldbacteria bacterium RIFCSPLOWO2_01_FULL_48_11 TaxID=1798543 RepID=A0A1G2B0R2_9BACT|nr:MAG: Glycosyl transferase family 2 [Parcubacteria group bacterium GW2011_GWA2_48_9]KKW16231.1 MAG: Glycosyl transferase family 2 [Parcubacteria group bacterium GW2011_GWC2_49_9]OGY82773.1 MAG: hypothetical protein A2898_04220 [Candidatus Kerfeldbacteria bacterium RIFCSPLOWO2_01_FULL_48_11]HCJ52678.1 glycosyl transferase family 2 [Candidatus Kerfeldbacteria bacterium]HCM67883.1 glycosyl transferase family 2 [Candidatus Kerfeldbacteria bacterium]
MDLSIIILNYKTRGLLRQCLRGIEQYSLSLAYEVIVVDNASRDGTREMMVEEFPHTLFIETPVNIGFAGGMNRGIRKSRGTYVLLLNTDVAILDNAIGKMFEYMENHPRVGIAGPRLINPDGSVQLSCYRFPTFMTALWRRTPFGKLPAVKRRLQKYLMLDFDHTVSSAVDWVLGACMIVRRQTFNKIGLLDERYFLYVEDTDWCRRCWQANWEVHYIAHAEMVHYHERKSAETPGLTGIFSYAARIHITSWIKYFYKYRGTPNPKHIS